MLDDVFPFDGLSFLPGHWFYAAVHISCYHKSLAWRIKAHQIFALPLQCVQYYNIVFPPILVSIAMFRPHYNLTVYTYITVVIEPAFEVDLFWCHHLLTSITRNSMQDLTICSSAVTHLLGRSFSTKDLRLLWCLVPWINLLSPVC